MLALVHVGSRFAGQAPAGSPIRAGLADASVTDVGYDGQFYYYMALDPTGASCCMDAPAYRYPRVAYPLTARALSLGIPALVPPAMLAINLVAIIGAVSLLAAWLRRKGLSGWWALVYGFYPGLFQAFQADVTEPMGYALVAAAIYALEFGGRRRLLWGGLLFAIAALTRETTLLFAAVYAVATGLRASGGTVRMLADGLGLALLAAAPALIYKAFLAIRFGSLGIGFKSGSELATAPFAGLFSWYPFQAQQWIEVAGAVLPATLIAALVVYRLARGPRCAELAAYLVNYVFLVALLQRASYSTYVDSGRIQSGVILAATLALPVLVGVSGASVESMPVRRWALAIVAVSGLFWLGVALPGVAAPHTFHVFKL